MAILAVAIAMAVRPTVDIRELKFSTVTIEDVEITATASGSVAPVAERVIVSPVSTRIIDVMKREGDFVDEGDELIRLDIQSTENQALSAADEGRLKEKELKQLHLVNATYLSNLEMQIKVKQMEIERQKARLANERRLDSIGSGTGEQVREAEVEMQRSVLELEQLRAQLANESASRKAGEDMKRLEISIHSKQSDEKAATLKASRILAPIDATITYLRDTPGDQVGQGERLAVLADLTGFRIDCNIPDTYASSVRPDARAYIKIGSRRLSGKVGAIRAQSKNGSLDFEVVPDSGDMSGLRPGLKTDVSVVDRIVEHATAIDNGSYYRGPGEYELYVDEGDGQLHRRKVMLGESNLDKVVVEYGLGAGERVVISDMSRFDKQSLTIKK